MIHRRHSWQLVRDLKHKKRNKNFEDGIDTTSEESVEEPPHVGEDKAENSNALKEQTASTSTAAQPQPLQHKSLKPRKPQHFDDKSLLMFGIVLVCFSLLMFSFFSFSLLSKLFAKWLLSTTATSSSIDTTTSSSSPPYLNAKTVFASGSLRHQAVHRKGLLQLIIEDWYYVSLIPLMIPVLIIFVYWNWLGMKLFRHN